MNFFITGYPRSRTAWFAAYLTTGAAFCYHEALNGCHARQEFYDLMEAGGRIGNSDCGLPLTDFQERYGAPTLIVHRGKSQVGFSALLPPQAYNSLEGLHVDFDEIDSRLEEITLYLGCEYFPKRAELFKKMNIQLKEITGDPESLRIWL